MAYPPAITLRPCTLGGSTALESGTQLVLSAEITASRSLKWGATGWQFPSLTRTVTGTEGAELSFSLPVTDLAGWRLNDDSGSIIDVSTPGSYTHTYTIKLKTLSGGRQISERTIGPFVLPTEDLSPIDLDLILPVATVAGGVVLVPGTWDARVAAAEAAAVAADAAAVRAVEEQGVYGSHWVFDGDSITIGAITTTVENQDRSGTWTADLAARSGGRIAYIANVAVGGQRTDQALARFDAYVAPLAPDVVMLSAGTNDISQGRVLSAWLADLDAYLAKCRAIGARLVLGGIYPKNATTATIAAWNLAGASWAVDNGVAVVPFWALADAASGSWPAGWSTDGTHPLAASPALSEIGRLAWDTVAPRCGTRALVGALHTGDGLLSNGFFLTKNATNSSVVTISAISATTGSLPAGTYEYRVVGANDYHRSASFDEDTITLAAPGGVELTRAATGSYNRWLVFRKAPGDSAFRFVTSVGSGTATWTDDGSLTSLWEWADDNTTSEPTGLTGATGGPYSLGYGPRTYSEAGVRGNILRVTCGDRQASSWEQHFEVPGLTPGQHLDVTLKIRGPVAPPDGKLAKVYLRWRSASAGVGNTLLWAQWVDDEWREIHYRALVPAGADRLRLSFQGDNTWPYLDVAEARISLAVD